MVVCRELLLLKWSSNHLNEERLGACLQCFAKLQDGFSRYRDRVCYVPDKVGAVTYQQTEVVPR